MERRYIASWAPDPRQPPRDSTQHPPHFNNQPQQGLRLPPPASLIPGAIGSRGPSQLQSPQHPGFAPAYPGIDVSTSTSHVSRPPPLGVPSHHNSAFAAGQQRQRALYLAQGPPVLASSPTQPPQAFQGQRILHPARQELAPTPQPPPLTYAPRPQAIDLRGDHRPDGQPQPAPQTMTTMIHTPASDSPTVSPSDPRPRHMSIPNLLSDGEDRKYSTTSRRPSGLDADYKLDIRQQPVAARSCGFGERDRRVIDPPPIVQLVIESSVLSREEISTRLRYPHYIMTCSIYDESGTRDAAFMPEEYRQQRRLMGSLVGAPFVGKDEFGQEGCFFCFPDLSCRTPGAFRLKFSLVMIDPPRASNVLHFPVLIEASSNVFTVYSAKDFPGMQASTKLTKRLKEQGCIISIKKGNDRSKNSRAHDESSDEDHDDKGTSSQGKRQRRSSQR
ncbi:hypothetical protein AK830_g3061 [Neonectria ditissima]|uniref:Velvet domain-containing protein n=1 Tax=Neonectria ditissima TaxID=78410 RepID=A0A0P7BQV2_9HYPO|nr:hypothetical protein AK830_g3061 [Neonectria ditissima]